MNRLIKSPTDACLASAHLRNSALADYCDHVPAHGINS